MQWSTSTVERNERENVLRGGGNHSNQLTLRPQRSAGPKIRIGRLLFLNILFGKTLDFPNKDFGHHITTNVKTKITQSLLCLACFITPQCL